MEVFSAESIPHVSGLKESDLNEFFLAYDPEFNKEDLHDRVLIFDVVKDERQENMNAAARLEGNVDICAVAEQNEYVEISKLENEIVNHSDRKRRAEDDKGNDDEQQQTPNLKKSKVNYENDTEDINIMTVFVKGKTLSEFGTGAGKDCISENMAPSDFIMSEPVIVRKHKILVHATFLAVHSKYFRALFYSGMKEATSKEVHIKIQESEEQSHLKMLEAIYRPYILNNLNVEELLQILELANKYDITYVFRKCKYLIQDSSLTIADCEMIINCIETKQDIPSTSDLVELVKEFLVKTFSPLDTNWENETFTNLSETLLRVLLSCQNLKTQSENTVFHALMHWVESTGYNYRFPSEGESLLSLVKFELLTIDYLYNVVQDHNIAKDMPSFSELYLNAITYHALPSPMRDDVVARLTGCWHPAYTWVITREEIETARNRRSAAVAVNNESNPESRSCVESSRFWWCGYQMQMILLFDTDSLSSYSPYFYGKLYLIVHGLKNRSSVPVRWSIVCDGVKLLIPSDTKTCLTLKKNSSEKKIQLWKVGPDATNLVLPDIVTIQIDIKHIAQF